MATTQVKLRRVGGSLMLAVPKDIVEELALRENQKVPARVQDGKLILEPGKRVRPKYRLADLLAQCDFTAPRNPTAQEWLDEPTVGAERIM